MSRPIAYKRNEMMIVSYKDVEYEFSDMRIDKDTIPEGRYVYEVADDDSDGEPCRIKEHILVNFLGTLISEHPLDLGDEGIIWVDSEDWYYL